MHESTGERGDQRGSLHHDAGANSESLHDNLTGDQRELDPVPSEVDRLLSERSNVVACYHEAFAARVAAYNELASIRQRLNDLGQELQTIDTRIEQLLEL
jgi:hypothetical protein